jgi:DNA-directed RNA polymerase specialized sigma24 family protein
LTLQSFADSKRRQQDSTDYYALSKRMRILGSILLSEVIAKLPKAYRQAVILHDIQGMEHNLRDFGIFCASDSLFSIIS